MNDAVALSDIPTTAPLPSPRLAALWKRGTDFFGCSIAIMGGAMTWVSERNLVAAISNAGGFGVLACGAMTPELLDAEIKVSVLIAEEYTELALRALHTAYNLDAA